MLTRRSLLASAATTPTAGAVVAPSLAQNAAVPAEVITTSVRRAQEVLADYICEGRDDREVLNRLLRILDHEDVVRAMRACEGLGQG